MDRLLKVDCYGDPLDPEMEYHIVPCSPLSRVEVVMGKDLLAAAAAIKELMKIKDTELGWQQFHESDPAVYAENGNE